MKYGDGSPVPEVAYGYVTFVANPAVDDTLAVGGQTLTFKASAGAAGQVAIGATKEDTVQNVVNAWAGTGTTGTTTYHADTPPLLLAIAEGTDNTLYLTAFFVGKLGNSTTMAIGGTGVSGRLTLSAATLLHGFDGGKAVAATGRIGFAKNVTAADEVVVGSVTYTFVASLVLADDVLIGATEFDTADNLVAAINGAAGEGTTYGTGTVANTAVTAKRVSNTVNVTAVTTGTNTTVLTETGTATAVTGAGTVQNGRALSSYKRSSLSWLKLPAREIQYAEQQMQQVFPPEINRRSTPFGAYKSGVAVAGSVSMLPRLESSLGNLFLATFGSASVSVAGTVGTHTFKFLSANETYQPWFAARRAVPGREAIPGQGLIGFDNKVARMRVAAQAAEILTADFDLEGRVPELDSHPEGWAGASFEDFESVPLACKGTLRFPTISDFADPLPVTSAVIELNNQITTPREEMILGSYFMDDIITRYRVMTISFMYKYGGPEVYQYLFGGAKGVKNWDPTPFITETSGGLNALELTFQAPFNIPSSSTPYTLTIIPNKVYWEPQRPISMQGGGIIMQEIRGTVLTPDDGVSYADLILKNKKTTAYAIPSEP